MHLRIFDIWLLENVFQRFSNCFQRFTGKDNFFLAFWILVVHIIGELIVSISHAPNWRMVTFLLFMNLGKLVGMTWVINGGRRDTTPDSRGFIYLNVLGRNETMRVVRIGISGFAIAGLAFLAGMISRGEVTEIILLDKLNRVLFPIVMYFASCTPLPPGTSTLSKWMSRAKEWVAGLLQPGTAAPAPT